MNAIVEKWIRLRVSDNDYRKVANEIDESFYAAYLSHTEEKNNQVRDQWGNWDIHYNDADHRSPFLDFLLDKKLADLNIAKRKLWPGDAKMAVVFSHDLDVISLNDPVQLVRKFNRVLPSISDKLQRSIIQLKINKYKLLSKLSVHNDDALWCYERWVDESKSLGFKNTFFIFIIPEEEHFHMFDCDYRLDDAMVYRGVKMSVAEFLVKLNSEGVEIGLHGSYNSYNNSELFEKQKRVLENVIGKTIHVTRQHFLKYDILNTPFVHRANGINVDSTLGYNRGIGFRAGTSFPYFLESGVLEIPQIVMDGALFRDNSLELSEAHACYKISKLFREVAETGGCLTFNFHPNYLNDQKSWNTYKFALQEAKRCNAWSASFSEIHDHINSI